MSEVRNPIEAGYYGYPEAKEGPQTGYTYTPSSNPVLRGVPLSIASSAVANLGFLSSFLWSNAGFTALRKLDLGDYDPRYDPAVVPLEKKGNSPSSGSVDIANLPYNASSKHPNRHWSVADYHSAFEAGKLTPLAVAEALLELSDSPKHKVAFLSVKRDQVIAAAKASTQRHKEGKAKGMFDGVPVAVKGDDVAHQALSQAVDEVDLQGHQKSLGSSKDFTSSKDVTSWCVQKWIEAGAVILGKLNMHELGMGMLMMSPGLDCIELIGHLDTTNNNPEKGTPLNPHNPHYYTGGSSGGSAYTVAAGLLPVTLGADGGGSIRIPAAYCGIYGLKPSHGRVSGAPTSGLASSCGVLGPMASNMADLEYAYRIMATPDPYDTTSSMFPFPLPPPQLNSERKVIGIYNPFFEVAEPAVIDACRAALSHYESAGYQVVDITLPYLPEGQLAHAMTILGEISSDLPNISGLASANKILISIGRITPVRDFFLAQKVRNVLMQHLAFLFQKYPGLLIVTPTTPNAGWHIAGGAADLKNGVSDGNMSIHTMTYVWMANYLGCPSLSIPVGRVKPKEGEGKVPVGLMAMAEWGQEEHLFAWGRVGEEWAWQVGEDRMAKPGNWVDVMELAKST